MEIERARLTKQLAKLKEEEGKVDEAAEILQEVAVVRPSWSIRLSSQLECCALGTEGCKVFALRYRCPPGKGLWGWPPSPILECDDADTHHAVAVRGAPPRVNSYAAASGSICTCRFVAACNGSDAFNEGR